VSDFEKFRKDFAKKTGIQLTDSNVREMEATFMNNLDLQPPILVNVNSRAFSGLSELAQKDPRGRQIAVAAIASAFRHELLNHVVQKWTDEVKCHEDERSHFLQLVAGMHLGEYQAEANNYAQSLAVTIAELKKEQKVAVVR